MKQLESIPGEWFGTYIKRVKEHIKDNNGEYMHIRFNDINLVVSHDSNVDDISTIYNLKKEIDKRNKS